LLFTLVELIGAIIWLSVNKDTHVAVAVKLSFFFLGILLANLAAVITSVLLKELPSDLTIKLPDTVVYVATLRVWKLWKAAAGRAEENSTAAGKRPFCFIHL